MLEVISFKMEYNIECNHDECHDCAYRIHRCMRFTYLASHPQQCCPLHKLKRDTFNYSVTVVLFQSNDFSCSVFALFISIV